MKIKSETVTIMTISLHPRVFEWLRGFEIVEYLSEDLIPVQGWIKFIQIELYNYMHYGYWDDEFEQNDWGDIANDWGGVTKKMAMNMILDLYKLVISDNIDYVKLEMEN